MSHSTGQALMARKLAAGRAVVDPADLAREHVLHMAFSRSAERAMKLPLRVQSCAVSVRSSAEIAESLPDNGLLLLTDGPDAGMGMVVLAPESLSCLIEVMTTGHLRDHAAPSRRPTRTDAAMAAGFVDTVLAEIEYLFSESDDLTWAGGFRYASHLPDPRPLTMLLEEPAYRTYRLQLAFGVPDGPQGDMRSGEVLLIYPAIGRMKAPQSNGTHPHEADGQHAQQAEWAQGLERAVLPAATQLEAVLARVTLPLSSVLGLESGQSLTLPVGVLQAVQLEGKGGVALCSGHLGQAGGQRALRVRFAGASTSGRADEMPVRPAALVPARDQPLSRPGAAARTIAASTPVAPVLSENTNPHEEMVAAVTGDQPLVGMTPAMAMTG